MSDLDPAMEAALLRQTEDALHEMCQAANNCGMKNAQLAMMLRREADKWAPLIGIETVTLQ
jgi:hypothetical protein